MLHPSKLGQEGKWLGWAPAKTQLPRAFSCFSHCFHFPPHFWWKRKTQDRQRVIRAAPRGHLWTHLLQRPGEERPRCEAALSHALALGSPSTQQGVARTSIWIPALPLSNHESLGQFLSTLVPWISRKQNGVITVSFSWVVSRIKWVSPGKLESCMVHGR